MTTYTTTLVAREEITDGTMAFHFEKPNGFAFKPGQAIDLIIAQPPAPTDNQGARHTFSIVSASFENELVVATRMRDSVFKRALKSLSIGAQVMIDGPFGSLGLHQDHTRPAVFIAGGIGITPFVSILRQAAKDQLPQRLILLYSNRRPEDAAFLAELQQLEVDNPHFRLVATMTDMRASTRPWAGHTELITGELVHSIVAELAMPIYYIVGPPGMVEAMWQTLSQAGIGDDDIRSEEFYGY